MSIKTVTPTMRNRVLKALKADPDHALPAAVISSRIGYSITSVKGGLHLLHQEKIVERIPTRDDRERPRMAWRLTDTYRAEIAAAATVAESDQQLPDHDPTNTPPAAVTCPVRQNLLTTASGYICKQLPVPDGTTEVLPTWKFLGIPLMHVTIGTFGAISNAFVCATPGRPDVATARIDWAPADVEWLPGAFVITPLRTSAAFEKYTGTTPHFPGAVALAWNWENPAS